MHKRTIKDFRGRKHFARKFIFFHSIHQSIEFPFQHHRTTIATLHTFSQCVQEGERWGLTIVVLNVSHL